MTTEADRAHGGGATRADGDMLRASDAFAAPMLRDIVAWLDVAAGSVALDVGSGAGGMTKLLAEAVGEAGRVTAFDIAPALLDTVRATLADTAAASRVAYREGDMTALPFADGAFDLVWCSAVVHGLPDQVAGLRELRRVVRSGGRLALREGGLAARFLPTDIGLGAPGLEARLQVAQQQWFAGWRARIPGSVAASVGWLALLREAGFARVTAHSFLLEHLPPFSNAQIAWLVGGLRGYLDNATLRAFVAPDDLHTLAQLVDPASPHFIGHRPNLYYVSAATVYVGYV